MDSHRCKLILWGLLEEDGSNILQIDSDHRFDFPGPVGGSMKPMLGFVVKESNRVRFIDYCSRNQGDLPGDFPAMFGEVPETEEPSKPTTTEPSRRSNRVSLPPLPPMLAYLIFLLAGRFRQDRTLC